MASEVRVYLSKEKCSSEIMKSRSIYLKFSAKGSEITAKLKWEAGQDFYLGYVTMFHVGLLFLTLTAFCA